MTPGLASLIKALAPLVGVAAMLVATRKRGLSWSADLGMRPPPVGATLGWLAGWATLVALEEHLHPTSPALWSTIDVLRIIALGFSGPVAEELAFRGVMFGVLARRGWSVAPLIAVTAVTWGLLHVQYDLLQIAFIVFDGLVLGLARAQTRSVFVPMLMHVGANLFSVAQSLGFWR